MSIEHELKNLKDKLANKGIDNPDNIQKHEKNRIAPAILNQVSGGGFVQYQSFTSTHTQNGTTTQENYKRPENNTP